MTHLIYLAAGASRRFGADKLLADYHGRPLFSHGLQTLAEVCAGRRDADLTVVTNTPAVAEAARALDARAVPSPRSDLGQSYSIGPGWTPWSRWGQGTSCSLRWPTSPGCDSEIARSGAFWRWRCPAPGRPRRPAVTGWAIRPLLRRAGPRPAGFAGGTGAAGRCSTVTRSGCCGWRALPRNWRTSTPPGDLP